MARRSATLARMEKAVSASRARAANLRKRIKKDQPVQVASTVAGAFIGGAVDKNTPAFMQGFGLEYPSLAIGVLAVSYGLISTKDGQMEKLATTLGTGMLAGVSYDFSKNKSPMV